MASTKLTRTAGTASNTYKATISAWVKRAATGTEHRIFTGWGGTNEQSVFTIGSDDRLVYQEWSGSFVCNYQTNRLLRDTSAFYHLMVAIDTTLSTATDRVKIYINGLEQRTNGGFSTDTQIAQNTQLFLSNYSSGQSHNVGARDSENYFDGLMTHVHLIDGTQYAATDFGETDSTSGVWKPKTAPSVTYGTNGFFLKFENSAAMGTDSSGNSNTFTVGAGTLTQNVDTPTNNFATLNPLIPNGGSYSNGNLTHTSTSNSYLSPYSSLGVSAGKWYVEIECDAVPSSGSSGIGVANSDSGVGFYKASSDKWIGQNTNDISYWINGYTYNNNTSGVQYSTYGAGDIIQIALDITNGFIYFGKNGTWQNSGDPTSGSSGTGGIALSTIGVNGTYFFGSVDINNSIHKHNFGQGFFGTTAVASANADANGHGAMEYAVPTGFYTLCTKNIKEFG